MNFYAVFINLSHSIYASCYQHC